MAKHLIIPLDIFKRGVLVFIGHPQELLDFIKKKDPTHLLDVAQQIDENERTLAQVIRTGYDAIIYAREMPNVMTLIHEAYHATVAVYEIIGVVPSDEEAYAYLLEYICHEIFRWLNIPFDIPN